jgi:hypothetical protein
MFLLNLPQKRRNIKTDNNNLKQSDSENEEIIIYPCHPRLWRIGADGVYVD